MFGFLKKSNKSILIYLYYNEPENLITSFANIVSESRTAIKKLNGRSVRKLLLVAGCCLLVVNASFGQAAGDFRTNGNVTFAAAANWQRYNGAAWVAAGAPPASTDGVITIRTSHTAIVTADKTLDQVVVESGGVLNINSGQDFTLSNGPGTDLNVFGTVNVSGIISQPGTVVFNASSMYNHTRDGGSIPNITWNASSNCNITGVTTNVPNGLGQSFGNFTWNCTGQTGSELNINQLDGVTIQGDFTLASTGTGSIRLANITPRVLDISGDFNISGGTFIVAILSGSGTVNIGGDFNMTGGTITETGSSSGLFVFDNGGTTQNFRRTVGSISSNIGFTVNSNVTIDFGTSDYANGAGTFTLSNGATLQTANSSGVNGSVQTTSRSLSTSANYTFDGTAAQVTGTYLPATVKNLTINNVNGITLTNTVTTVGTLYMNSGNIKTGANTIILSSALSSALNYTAGIIVGRFERFINTTSTNYFFPVGIIGQIQSLTANFTNLTAGSLLVQYITGDPENLGLPLTDGDGSQITNQFTTGYWSALAKNSLASTNYNINLDATGFGLYVINAGTRLIKRTDAGGSWLLNGTHSGAVGSVVKRTGMSGIFNAGGGTQFGIGRSCPKIITQPSNQIVCENATANFSIVATGSALTYQWFKAPGTSLTNNGHYGGVTTSALSITTVVVGDAGTYYCIVTDGNGSTAQSTSISLTVNPLPVPTVAGPTMVCLGVAGNVYTTEAGMSNYTWGVSAGGTITAGGGTGNNTVTVTWTTTGAKTVTVNYNNLNGCTATSPTIYNVTVNALPVPTIAGTTPVCVGVAGNIYTTEAGMSNYTWGVSVGGTLTAGGGTGNNTVTVTWATTGAKTITVNYNNLNGCTATSPTTYNVTVNALPVPTIAGPTPVCVGVTGNVYTTEAGMSNYLWTVSAGGTITAGGGTGNNTVTVTWTTTGAKTVTVNYNNLNGCTATSPTTYNVTVNALPVPTIAGPTPVCVGVVGNVYTTEAGMSNYTWGVSVGGTLTAGGRTGNNTVTVTWATTGAKTVTVNYNNLNGCTATSPTTYNVTVNALPVAMASNNGPICTGSALSLTGGPAAMMTYSWTGPNGFTSLLQNPSVSAPATLAMAGVYTLTVTNAGVCMSTSTTTVTVNENPIAIAGPAQELTFVFETQMAAELSSPDTGEWSLISGSGHISDIHSPTTMVTELSTGENIFLWKVQNSSCEASAEVKITVYDLFVPSVITPDGDGKNDYFKIIENIGKVELIIFNRWGNVEYTNGNYLNDWDGRNNKGLELPMDTYFYVLKFEDGKIKKGSVLVKR